MWCHVMQIYYCWIINMVFCQWKGKVLKHELKMSPNRSTSQDETGKWHQIACSSYVRNFYLPYHFPIESYHSHLFLLLMMLRMEDYQISI